MKIKIRLIIIHALFSCFLLPYKTNAQDTITDSSILKKETIKIDLETFHYQEVLYYNDDDFWKYAEFQLFDKKEKILSRRLFAEDGDAETHQIELGDFEVKDSLLYLYNYWCFYGTCHSLENGMPYGAQIQIFKLDKNKNLVCSSSKIFMEMCSYYIADMTATERKKYIRQIEKEYNAQFVQGEAAQQLIQEVKSKLHKQIADKTKYWDKIERPKRW